MFFLTSKKVWQSKLIFLYLIDAMNFAFSSQNSYCFLKSINIDFPELEIDFKSLLFEFPFASPIFIDCSSGPS